MRKFLALAVIAVGPAYAADIGGWKVSDGFPGKAGVVFDTPDYKHEYLVAMLHCQGRPLVLEIDACAGRDRCLAELVVDGRSFPVSGEVAESPVDEWDAFLRIPLAGKPALVSALSGANTITARTEDGKEIGLTYPGLHNAVSSVIKACGP